MIPSWIPASSLARRGDSPEDCARLRLRPPLSPPSDSILSSASSAPSPLSPTHPLKPTMQSVPESRQQTFEEIYGPPENFLEIEVSHRSPLYIHTAICGTIPKCLVPTPSPKAIPAICPQNSGLMTRPTRCAIRKRTARRETCTPHMRSCAAPISPPSS